jgi:hypothetical protein
MRRVYSLIVLLSVLGIQLHGLAHSSTNNLDEDKSCVICTTQAKNLSSAAINPPIEHIPIINFKPFIENIAFIPKSKTHQLAFPRAPPIA